MEFNIDHVDDSDHNVTGYSEQDVEDNSLYIDEIRQNEEDDDDEEEEELEILLLDMDENTVWEEEYNLTEEEENYLLSDDCPEHYPNNIGVPNSNNESTLEDATDLHFIGSMNTEDRQKVYSGEIKSNAHNSNSVPNYVNKYEKGNNLANKKFENVGTTERTIQIVLKDFREYPDAKYKIQNGFYDIVEQEKNVYDLNEGVGETLYISETGDQKEFSENENNDNSDDLLKPYADPEDTNLTMRNPMKKDADFNEELKSKESMKPCVVSKEEALLKVMSCNSARKVYLSMLKEKAEYQLVRFNEIKDEILRNSSKFVEELQRNQIYKNNKGRSTELSHESEMHKIKPSQESRTKPCIIFLEKAKDPSTEQVSVDAGKPSEKEIVHFAGSLERANEEDLRQTRVKKGTETEFLHQTVPKISEKIVEKEIQSETCLEGKTTYSTSGLVCYTSEKSASYGTAGTSGSKNKDISEMFSAYQQQDVEMKDLSTLPKAQLNQVITAEEGINFSEGKVLNRTSRYRPGSTFTEILNSTLYKEYNAMDFNNHLSAEHCSHCSNIVSDVNNIIMPHSRIQSEEADHKTTQKSTIHFKTKTLLELFSLNNKIVKSILSALLSEQFKTGALLIDIMKYLRREMSLNITSKLKQDVRKFLEAAKDAGIVKMKYRRYVLTRGKDLRDVRKALNKKVRRNRSKVTINKLSKGKRRSKQN